MRRRERVLLLAQVEPWAGGGRMLDERVGLSNGRKLSTNSVPPGVYSASQGKFLTLMLKMEPGPERRPGVACNKHQERERKPQQYLFKPHFSQHASSRQTFAQHLATLLPSHPKPRQTKQYEDSRLTADVHRKHCSKQTCAKRARPQSDC